MKLAKTGRGRAISKRGVELLSATQVGIAGEYLVAAELSRKGFVAALTLRNTKGIDILASNAVATKSVGIQVKTSRNSKRDWILSKKAEADSAKNSFYVFVVLHSDSAEYFIVPRRVVAKHVRESHKAWLATPGQNGQAHNDTKMRRFWDLKKDLEAKFRDRWDLLGLD